MIAELVRGLVARFFITATTDSNPLRKLQGKPHANELENGATQFQEYGFSSRPMPGAEGIRILVAGAPDHAVVIATEDRRYRPQGMSDGEVAIYTTYGLAVLVRPDGSISIAGTAIDVSGDSLALAATGDVTIDGAQVLIQGKAFLPHTHPGDSGGTTGGVN